MGRRANTATWIDQYNRWQIKVQKDRIRKTFYSSEKERKRQCGCHRYDFNTFGWYSHAVGGESELTASLIEENLAKLLQ